MKYIFVLIACFIINTIVVTAQPGTLDKSFGKGGVVFGQGYTGDCQKVLIQNDGKIVAAGSGGYNNIYDFLVVRYNIDGSPDLSFGDSGRAVISFENRQEIKLQKAALQPDGKIVAAGWANFANIPQNTAFPIVARYTAYGTADSSFGTNGKVVTMLDDDADLAGVAVQKDGKIIVAGYILNTETSENSIFIIRYNEDGSLDDSFGKKGIMLDANQDVISAKAMLLQPDGKIVVGGEYILTNGQAFFTRRYLPNGSPDKAYGENGEAISPFTANGSSYLASLALQPDGQIVAAGSYYINDDQQRGILVRFTADGIADKSFGEKGRTLISYPDKSQSQVVDIAVQPDGKPVAAIRNFQQFSASFSNFSVARFTDDGAPDLSFADNGVQVTPLDYYSSPASVTLQKDGKIVLGGTTYNPRSSFALIRYNGDEQGKQPLMVRIKRWLLHHGISWQVQPNKDVRYYAVQRSADGIVYKEIARLSNKTQVDKYEDAATITGSSYYRLAAIGWDGSRTYSNTVLIDDNVQVKVFPNPVRDNLQLQGLATGKTNVSIVDLHGNVRSSSVAGGANYSVNTSQLTPGNYLLKLQHNSTTTTQPFVKE